MPTSIPNWSSSEDAPARVLRSVVRDYKYFNTIDDVIMGYSNSLKTWEINQYGILLTLQDEDSRNIYWELPDTRTRVGYIGATWVASDDDITGTFQIDSPTTTGNSQLLLTSTSKTGAIATAATIGLAANHDQVPTARLTISSNDPDATACLNIEHLTAFGGDTPTAGFGAGIHLKAESSTTAAQTLALITAEWTTATHASRAAQVKIQVADHATTRDALTLQADGSEIKISVFGATPVVRQAHIADPAGGATVDAEARSAIASILTALENYGWLKTA